jgi:hypothetical protein
MRRIAATIALTAAATLASLAIGAPATSATGAPRMPASFTGYVLVNSELADALAEGDAPDATTRNWRRCLAKVTSTQTIVICPDGFSQID